MGIRCNVIVTIASKNRLFASTVRWAVAGRRAFSLALLAGWRAFRSALLAGRRAFSSALFTERRAFSSALLAERRAFSSALLVGRRVFSSALLTGRPAAARASDERVFDHAEAGEGVDVEHVVGVGIRRDAAQLSSETTVVGGGGGGGAADADGEDAHAGVVQAARLGQRPAAVPRRRPVRDHHRDVAHIEPVTGGAGAEDLLSSHHQRRGRVGVRALHEADGPDRRHRLPLRRVRAQVEDEARLAGEGDDGDGDPARRHVQLADDGRRKVDHLLPVERANAPRRVE